MWNARSKLYRQLDWAQQELTALREERTLLLRDLNMARDRGDQAVNALLAAHGERPLVASPPPSAPPPDRDVFEEEPGLVAAIRALIQEQGVEAVTDAH